MDIRIDFSFNNAYNKTIKKAGDNVLQDIDILSLANFNKYFPYEFLLNFS